MNTLDAIKTHEIPTASDLMQIVRTSARFLDTAASKVGNPALKSLFNDMATSRSQFIDGAQKQLPGNADGSASMARDIKERTTAAVMPGRSVQEWNTFYSELQPRIEGLSPAFVDSVQASETRLLSALDKLAADTTMPMGLKQAVIGYLPIMRKQHLMVGSRQWAKAA